MMFVYIVRCKDGSLYTGWTDDIEKRLAAHNSGKGAKYTRGRVPVQLVYSETVPSKSDALKREAVLKKMGKNAKEQLAQSYLSATEKEGKNPTAL